MAKGKKKGGSKKTYKNPSARKTAKKTFRYIPQAAAVGIGLVGSRTVVNMALPTQTGYVRALAQGAIGLVLYLISGNVKKLKKYSEYLMLGGFAGGLLTAADTAVPGYNLADEYIQIGGGGPMRALPGGRANMSGAYGRTPTTLRQSRTLKTASNF